MIDSATTAQLADLRRHITETHAAAGSALDAMARARSQAQGLAEATPFLADCARELEALAGVCRLAADAGQRGATD